MFLKILTSPVWCLVLTSIIMLVSVYCTTKTGDSRWVSRAGAMVTLAGLLLTTRSLLRHSVSESLLSRTVIDGGSFDPNKENEQELACTDQ